MPTDTCGPYTKSEVIGRGSYGVVYRGVNNETKQLVAIKILNLDTEEEEVADVQKEIVLLQSLKAGDAHNVVHYHGCFLHGTRLWVIMDYCQGGSIRTLMKAGRIEEKYIAIIVREVLAALSFVHKSNIIHRDIKAANILVSNDGRIQLCDFGVAAQLAASHLKRNTFVGTPYWMAPEVISDGLSYNFKADVWSLGITIYEIAYGNPPYADQEPMRAVFLIPRSTPPKIDGAQFSPAMKEFVASCLCEKPEDRLSAAELQKHKFIKLTSRVSTAIMRELIGRYEAWRKSGGVRQSLAPRADAVDDEDDGGNQTFQWEDGASDNDDDWDFGDLQQGAAPLPMDPPLPDDMQSDDLTTIKPHAHTINNGIAATAGLARGLSRSGTLPTQLSRQDSHPLMKLFESEHQPSSGASVVESPSFRHKGPLADLMRESRPSTPLSETPSIELPDLSSSFVTSSSISLPLMNSSTSHPTGPARKVTYDEEQPGSSSSSIGGSREAKAGAFAFPPSVTNSAADKPGTSSSTTVSPVRTAGDGTSDASRSSSPTRNILSPPTSPSRTIRPQATVPIRVIGPPPPRPKLFSSASASVLPSYNSSTGPSRPVTPAGAGPGLIEPPPAMPIPSYVQSRPVGLALAIPSPFEPLGARLDGLEPTSATATTAATTSIPFHRPRAPTLADQLDTTFDSSSESYHARHMSEEDAADTLAELKHLTNGGGGGAINGGFGLHLPAAHVKLDDLEPLTALDLDVLTTQDPDRVVRELDRVVAQMMHYLETIEDGLSKMSLRS